MTKEEFVRNCIRSRYATREVAEKYAGDRTDFTDADYIEVYHIQEARRDALAGHAMGEDRFHYYQGVKTTKLIDDD